MIISIDVSRQRNKLRFNRPIEYCESDGSGGYFHIRRSGGLDLTETLETKFGARSLGEKLGKFWYQKRQKLGQNPGKEDLIIVI